MKAIIGLLFAVLSFTGTAQKFVFHPDDPGKYLYTVMGISAKDFADGASGTGVFIKKNGNLYLVTTRHTFYACDSVTREWKARFAYNLLDLGDQSTPLVLQIPATYGKWEEVQRDTDLLLIKMDPALATVVNSMEETMLPGFKYAAPPSEGALVARQ